MKWSYPIAGLAVALALMPLLSCSSGGGDGDDEPRECACGPYRITVDSTTGEIVVHNFWNNGDDERAACTPPGNIYVHCERETIDAPLRCVEIFNIEYCDGIPCRFLIVLDDIYESNCDFS